MTQEDLNRAAIQSVFEQRAREQDALARAVFSAKAAEPAKPGTQAAPAKASKSAKPERGLVTQTVLDVFGPVMGTALVAGGALAKAEMAKSSGGDLPAAKIQGAPSKASQLTSRPKSAAALYDDALAAIMMGRGPDMSYRQLKNFAGVVPAAAKPPSIEDTIMADLYQQAQYLANLEVAEAQKRGDAEAEVSAFERFRQRTMPLVTNNTDLSALLAGDKG